MGCAGSKSVEVADVYHPPPTSVALFDINTIDEPWLVKAANAVTADTEVDEHDEEEVKKKPMHIPLPILEKLESYELTPNSWSEVSKALEDIKPSLHQDTKVVVPPPSKKKMLAPNSPPRPAPPELAGFRPVKENSFLLRDRQEREKSNNLMPFKRRDPLEGYQEISPPGDAIGVVLYTTTLGGVRRTFEDCDRARKIVEVVAEATGLDVDERNVSLHGEFLKELRELVGEGVPVPRLFIMGRYIGGVEEVVELNDAGKLKEMMRWVAARGGKKEGGRRDCESCGNARFIPCLECNGSCKVVGEDGKEVVRCCNCNENGLMLCPFCHS